MTSDPHQKRRNVGPPPRPLPAQDEPPAPYHRDEPMRSLVHLAVALGGDVHSLTYRVLVLLGQSNAVERHRIARGFPREAWALRYWRECVEAGQKPTASQLAAKLDSRVGELVDGEPDWRHVAIQVYREDGRCNGLTSPERDALLAAVAAFAADPDAQAAHLDGIAQDARRLIGRYDPLDPRVPLSDITTTAD